MCTGTQKMDVSSSGLSLGDIPEGYSSPPRWHKRKRGNQAKVLMVRNWTSIWNAIRSAPGASPPHLMVGRGGIIVDTASVRVGGGGLGGRPVSTPS